MLARTEQRCDRQVAGCLTAGGSNRANASLKRRNALLQHRRRRVGDARVNMACPFNIEQRGRMVRAFKNKGGGLVDRCCPCTGSRIRLLPCMQTESIKAEGFYFAHGIPACSIV